MKKIFTLLFCLGTAVFAGAQIQLTPATVNITVDEEDIQQFEVVSKGLVKNMSNSVKKYRWERVEECMSEEWQSLICDKNLCYSPTTGASPKAFILAPGEEGTMDTHIRPNNFMGAGKVKVRVYEEADPTVEVFQIINFNTCTVASSQNINPADLKLFPNPTSGQFQLSSVDGVKKIEVYNVVGSRLKAFSASEGEKYDVSDLNSGIYMVRLLGSNDKIVKTIRLNVR